MRMYTTVPKTVLAVQYLPGVDNELMLVPVRGASWCKRCGETVGTHVFYDTPNDDELFLCPGMWVVQVGNKYKTMTDAEFVTNYKLIEE